MDLTCALRVQERASANRYPLNDADSYSNAQPCR